MMFFHFRIIIYYLIAPTKCIPTYTLSLNSCYFLRIPSHNTFHNIVLKNNLSNLFHHYTIIYNSLPFSLNQSLNMFLYFPFSQHPPLHLLILSLFLIFLCFIAIFFSHLFYALLVICLYAFLYFQLSYS